MPLGIGTFLANENKEIKLIGVVEIHGWKAEKIQDEGTNAMRISQTKMGTPAGSLLPFLVNNLRSCQSGEGRILPYLLIENNLRKMDGQVGVAAHLQCQTKQ
jgi:hypothetical protein